MTDVKTIGSLREEDIGRNIRIGYTPMSGVLTHVDHDYGDESLVVVGGMAVYLPREFPVYDNITDDEYHPSVLTGVVDPWSPYD